MGRSADLIHARRGKATEQSHEGRIETAGKAQKQLDELASRRFVRAGLVMCAFDEARESGHKHSSAITHAVEYVRQRHPEMPISKTQVKRTLATYRPLNSRTILRSKRSIFDDEKLARLRCMLEQVAKVRGEKNQSASPPLTQEIA
jgi:hypothetical protein